MLRDFDAGDFAGGQFGGQLRDAQVVQVRRGFRGAAHSITLGTRKQAALHGGGAHLAGVALVGLAGDVFAQAQRDFADHRGRVGQGLHALGVDGFHLLDQGKKAVELGQGVLGFVGAQFQPRQVGDAGDVLGCQCHG
jgi:hypothetical protein